MTDDEYTPFVFINNELSAIGWESLADLKQEVLVKLKLVRRFKRISGFR